MSLYIFQLSQLRISAPLWLVSIHILKSFSMASLKHLCLVLFFTSMLVCHDARPLPSSLPSTNENHAFLESAKTVLKEIIKRKQLLGTQYKPNRLSPGGPDPHHH